jgi:hypothetical protein
VNRILALLTRSVVYERALALLGNALHVAVDVLEGSAVFGAKVV